MNIVDVIESLPDSVMGRALSSFVDLWDIANLDSALCNSTQRTNILKMMYSQNITFPANELQFKEFKCESLVEWIFLRNVGGAQPANLILNSTYGHVRLLSERGFRKTN